MTKPILYYRILQYQPENLEKLHELFEVITLDNPQQDTIEILNKVNLLLLLGIWLTKKIDACNNLKFIASNTTGHPHIDIDYARKQVDVACLKFFHFLKKITPTAELSLGLIITLTRNVIPAHSKVRKAYGTGAYLEPIRCCLQCN